MIIYEILLLFAWLYVSVIKTLDFPCCIVETVSGDGRWFDARCRIILPSHPNLDPLFETKESRWVPTLGIVRGRFENLFEVESIRPFSVPLIIPIGGTIHFKKRLSL